MKLEAILTEGFKESTTDYTDFTDMANSEQGERRHFEAFRPGPNYSILLQTQFCLPFAKRSLVG